MGGVRPRCPGPCEQEGSPNSGEKLLLAGGQAKKGMMVPSGRHAGVGIEPHAPLPLSLYLGIGAAVQPGSLASESPRFSGKELRSSPEAPPPPPPRSPLPASVLWLGASIVALAAAGRTRREGVIATTSCSSGPGVAPPLRTVGAGPRYNRESEGGGVAEGGRPPGKSTETPQVVGAARGGVGRPQLPSSKGPGPRAILRAQSAPAKKDLDKSPSPPPKKS